MRRTGMSAVTLALLATAGCSSSTPSAPAPSAQQVTQTDTVTDPALQAPVDVVRDEWGIPHIYGSNLPDVFYAEGFMMASDRLIEMDLGRRQAEGTLAELVGGVEPSIIDADINMRLQHFRSTAQAAWAQLQSSSDPNDQTLAKGLTSFAAGVNAFIADAKAGRRQVVPPGTGYNVNNTPAWTEVDSIALSYLQAFDLSFDAASEINYTAIQLAEATVVDNSSDPNLRARKGIGKDLEIFAPFDPTYTKPGGFTGLDGDTSTASFTAPSAAKRLLNVLRADAKAVAGIGNDHTRYMGRGSNNWILGPQLSSTGHVLVANDTHLALSNPPVFYMAHLVVTDSSAPLDVMGEQFPGAPAIVLGNNQHIAWGATVSNIDVTDVYQETVVPCGSAAMQGSNAPCVMFQGHPVQITPRVETINIGVAGNITSSEKVTLYDVPQHGPIIPHINADHTVAPLGMTELSIKYTGYEPANLLRALVGVNTATTMQQAVAALDRDFKYGGQNWVIGDDQGNFGWTEIERVPRRAAGHPPYAVLPGDGSAEWGPDMDPRYIPHAYNPAAGFIATANNDPIGVTDKNDPYFSQPVVNGAPLYLGWNYDPGTRVGRITKRIQGGTANGGKLSLDDMQSIQADIVTEWQQAFVPTFLDASAALSADVSRPGSQPDVAAIATAADAPAKALVGKAHDIVAGWMSFDTPSGLEPGATPQQIADSQATIIAAVWLTHFAHRALDDELTKMNVTVDPNFEGKLLARMCTNPRTLATGVAPQTGDSILFDDLNTAPIESKRQIAAQAVVDALDFLASKLGPDITTWRWGELHTLTLDFLLPIGALNLPPAASPQFPNGYPRHGDNGTVDVGPYGLSLTDYSYKTGPAIRYVCDLDPSGPHPRNALPGGEITDPSSPHYADQLQLWLQNKTFDLAFQDGDVVSSAQKELAAHGDGRIHFQP